MASKPTSPAGLSVKLHLLSSTALQENQLLSVHERVIYCRARMVHQHRCTSLPMTHHASLYVTHNYCPSCIAHHCPSNTNTPYVTAYHTSLRRITAHHTTLHITLRQLCIAAHHSASHAHTSQRITRPYNTLFQRGIVSLHALACALAGCMAYR